MGSFYAFCKNQQSFLPYVQTLIKTDHKDGLIEIVLVAERTGMYLDKICFSLVEKKEA